MSDPNQPLRDDIRVMGQVLGEIFSEQLGPPFLAQVETIRQLSKSGRGGNKADLQKLLSLLRALHPHESLLLSRAFSQFLSLANFAESHHRIRRRKFYMRQKKSAPQPGSNIAVIDQLLSAGHEKALIAKTITELNLHLVLTAHPTETLRRSLQQKYLTIAKILSKRDHTDLTPPERTELGIQLKRVIMSAWMTSDVRAKRPTPVQEAESGLAIFENVLWDAVPKFLRSLDETLQEKTGIPLPLEATPVVFDSWMGGDRDGNPSVTPEMTERAVYLSRWMASELYYRELDKLLSELSMQDASTELKTSLKGVLANEPYRAILRPLRERMRATGLHFYQLYKKKQHPGGDVHPVDVQSQDFILEAQELLTPLMLCYRSLNETKAGLIANGRLKDLIRRLHSFGLSLVKLDLRQDSSRHASLMSAVTKALGLGDFSAWEEEAKQEFLIRELQNPRPLIPDDLALGADDEDTLKTFQMISKLPAHSLGAYVISMAHEPSDILTVELLQKACGPRRLRVVPLFEQVEDLRLAGRHLQKLFSIPWYLEHIKGKQEVMIGYSDSAKTAGRFTASWELYQAQEAITEVCARFKVRPTLFHGRGGSVSRGGGPTFKAIAGQPPGSIQGSMRVTEQGEMILAKFGLPELATRNLELYTSAMLENALAPIPQPKKQWRELMRTLSSVAEASYRDLIENREGFLDYFHAATPSEELGLVNIGSRPAKRTSGIKKPASQVSGEAKGATMGTAIQSLRAIPWSFAWTQTRLNLPTWLGIDAVLRHAKENHCENLVQDMYQTWPFFRSTLDLVEMVLAKSDMAAAARYDEALVPPELQPIGLELRGRHDQLVRDLLELSGQTILLESNPVLRRSIEVRNPYIDPINFMQVELLRELRESPDSSELQEALTVTINGIAAGMRNTG